jgi:hypothetical protein
MSVYHHALNAEADEKMGLAALFAQSATAGVATTGVLTGLAVTQTTTASTAVQIAQGAGVVQSSLTAGASLLYNPAPTLDILTANPVGSLPRYDIVAFDSLTGNVSALIGTPNATPTDPTVPSTSLRLARIRNVANAAAIDSAHIDDLRVFTTLLQAPEPAPVVAEYARGTSPGFSGSAWTKLGFLTQVEISGITYSGGDFTVPTAGRYDCTFQVAFPSAPGLTTVGAQIAVNGTDAAYQNYPAQATYGNWSANVTRTLRLNAGDKVSFLAYHDASAALATIASTAATWAQIQRVSA